jgi:hypothetical protein
MPEHVSRFPGITNDPAEHVLTERQAARLSTLARVPAAELAGKKISDIAERLRARIDPKLLFSQTICGQVVKTDASGNDLPVPFATVTVYDMTPTCGSWCGRRPGRSILGAFRGWCGGRSLPR